MNTAVTALPARDNCSETFARGHRKTLARMAFAALLLLTQSACSVFQPVADLFGDDDVEGPAELQDFDQELRLNRLWSTGVGDGQGRYYNQLTPAIDREFIYAAGADGTVVAINRADGDVLWRNRTDEAISGGVGAAFGMVLFGTREAEVFALDQLSGRVLWSAPVTSEVLSAPQTNGEIVVAQTVDGKLIGLDAVTGAQRWIYETTIPALTLRGNSKPVMAGDRVLAGFASGMIAAVNAENGFLLWEERVAIPQGRYDIERVIDVDGDLMLSGNTVYASSYQGNLMGLDIATGRIVWGIEASSYQGLAQGFGNIYYSNDKSHLIALRNNSDQVVWENDDLRLRSITAPATLGNYVAVADFEGYLHLLSQVDGHFVSRVRVDGDGVRASLVTDSNTIYVFGNSGTLTAYSIR